MKKSFISVVMIFVLLFSVPQVFGQSNNLYENSKYGFSIEKPNDWIIISSTYEGFDGLIPAVIFFENSSDREYKPILDVKIDNLENNDVESYVKERAGFIQKNYARIIDQSQNEVLASYLQGDLSDKEYEDTEVIVESQDTSIGKLYNITYQSTRICFVAYEECNIIISEMILNYDNVIYIITFSAEPDDFISYTNEIVQSTLSLVVSDDLKKTSKVELSLKSQDGFFVNENLGLKIKIPSGWNGEITGPEGWMYGNPEPYGIGVTPIVDDILTDNKREVMFLTISSLKNLDQSYKDDTNQIVVNGLNGFENTIVTDTTRIKNYYIDVDGKSMWFGYHQPTGYKDRLEDFEKFVYSLQIKEATEEIDDIPIPSVSESSKHVEIPDWVKGIAGWWAEDKISESEFINAMEFLVTQKIIKPSIVTELQNQVSELQEKIDSAQKRILSLEQQLSELEKVPSDVNDDVSEPDLNIEKGIADAWSKGQITDAEYIIAMQKLIDEGKILPFDGISDEYNHNNSIPSWIKNNAGWWADGSIDDEGYRQGILYLFKIGVLRNPLN